MIKIFRKTPREGRPISTIGFADGLRKMAYAWENLSMRGGHIEWSCWGAPTIVVDPAATSDVLSEGESAASGDIVVAKITGGTTLTGYDITCYPAYPATTASYAAKLAVPEIALGTELPVNTYVIAHKLSVEIIGGSMA